MAVTLPLRWHLAFRQIQQVNTSVPGYPTDWQTRHPQSLQLMLTDCKLAFRQGETELIVVTSSQRKLKRPIGKGITQCSSRRGKLRVDFHPHATCLCQVSDIRQQTIGNIYGRTRIVQQSPPRADSRPGLAVGVRQRTRILATFLQQFQTGANITQGSGDADEICRVWPPNGATAFPGGNEPST